MPHSTLCLFGAGGHGKVVASQIKPQWQGAICFADADVPIGTKVSGIPVSFLAITDIADCAIMITIGSCTLRQSLQEQAEIIGLPIATLVIDSARFFGRAPGAGSMILAGATVNIDTSIGRGVIANTGAIVEHDCQIGDFCHLAPGSVVLGGSVLKERVWLGANATVSQGVTISEDVVIGAGSVVLTDINEPGTYVGIPAQKVRG
jgi:UDP-N-acetylbacillosamine N-acetyltransferase